MWTTKKPIKTHEIKKILVIQFRPFGDVFLTSAIFETIKKHFPDAKLYYLVKNPYQVTVLEHPFLDHIIPFSQEKGIKYFTNRIKLFKQIRDLKFDLIIDQQNNPGSQQLCLFSGAKYRIGYASGQFSFVYNYKVSKGPDRYTPCQRFDLLKPIGIDEEPWHFHYHIKQESQTYIDKWLQETGLENQDFIVFSPGSPVLKKKWRLSYYANLGDLIIKELGLKVVLLWAKNEYNDCQYVFEHMLNKPIMALETNLNQASALLKKAKILICNDGGINHISCATDTKTIAIFGNTNPAHWSPASVFPHHHHLFKENFPSDKDDSFGISPQDVLTKIKEILTNE